jgi:hypothetical protein
MRKNILSTAMGSRSLPKELADMVIQNLDVNSQALASLGCTSSVFRHFDISRADQGRARPVSQNYGRQEPQQQRHDVPYSFIRWWKTLNTERRSRSFPSHLICSSPVERLWNSMTRYLDRCVVTSYWILPVVATTWFRTIASCRIAHSCSLNPNYRK